MAKNETYPHPQVRRHVVKTLGDLYTLAGYFDLHDIQIAIRTCEIRVLSEGRPPVRRSCSPHVQTQ